jgi:hypothetical protein
MVSVDVFINEALGFTKRHKDLNDVHKERGTKGRRNNVANYYTEYHVVIENLSLQEYDWLETLKIENLAPELPEPDMIGFSWELICKPNSLTFWLRGHDMIENACVFLQMFLRKFRPAEVIKFEWAEFCSKPRVDGFGGGAAIVSARDYVCRNTSDILRDLEKELVA